MNTNAIRIAEDGTVTQHDLAESKSSLDALQALVGGWIEGFGVSPEAESLGVWAYGNEESRLIGMEDNPLAARVCGHVPPYADTIYGPVVFVLPDVYDEDTDESESTPYFTDEQIASVLTYIESHR